ncbi:HAD family hydrolase [Thiorhodococcus minor]|uniref:HAD family hydrolase n=1 Tax=Thiorhodococcus minor TaxID=57489 RepID=A0A6M0JY64_9GAMM|nr:hypothetical protein [Thiorhodococcus minor]NEV61045.1 hypothetical protein [Thiorhodococcus minor]
MIHSFDVFDTLITRRVATPRGVFVAMQRQLAAQHPELPRPLLERFAHERMHAEQSARIQAREQAPADTGLIPEEIDIEDVYRWLVSQHGLDADWIARFIEIELAAEERFIIGVPEMLARFRALVAKGERILLLSDMYLRRQDLARLLDKVDPALLQHASLYLSSEVKLNKASGLMFDHVAAQEGIAPGAIHHIGDNPHSDVRRARERGCQVTFFDACHLTLDESFERNEDDLGWQVSVGLFRESRLSLPTDAARVGGSYAAMVLLPFVLWVLDQAREAGRKRLYFFARDGQILLEIARRLSVEDLELRYLHVSRLALHRCVNTDFEAFLDWVFVSHQGMTIEDVAHRVTSDPGDLVDHLLGCVDAALSREDLLTDKQRMALRNRFKSDPDLRARVMGLVSSERERVLRYLDQEGLARLDDACVVDIGWSGSIQDSLLQVLRTHGSVDGGPLAGYYWGLQRHTLTDLGANLKSSFAFHPDSFWRDPAALRELVECFTAADHGSTLGYRENGGRIEPILNAEGPEVLAWGLRDFRRGVDFFVGRIIGMLGQDEILALMPYYFRRLEHLIQRPSRVLASAMGRFPYSPDPTGMLLPFAPPIDGLDAMRFQMSSGTRRGRITRWRQGSLANSDPWVRYLLSSKSTAFFALLKGLHPRGLVHLLPYPMISWVKRTFPAPMLRACRSILRI